MTKPEINIDSVLLTTDSIRIWTVFPVISFLLFQDLTQDSKLHLAAAFLGSEIFFFVVSYPCRKVAICKLKIRHQLVSCGVFCFLVSCLRCQIPWEQGSCLGCSSLYPLQPAIVGPQLFVEWMSEWESCIMETRCKGSRKLTSVCWNIHFLTKHILAAAFRNTGFHNLDGNVCVFNILGQDAFVYIPLFHCIVPFGSHTLGDLHCTGLYMAQSNCSVSALLLSLLSIVTILTGLGYHCSTFSWKHSYFLRGI